MLSIFFSRCGNNTIDMQQQSITENGISIQFGIPKEFKFKTHAYCDAVLNMAYSYSNNKFVYQCPEKWIVKEESDSIGDQFIIYIYSKNYQKGFHFNESYLKQIVESKIIENPTTKVIKSILNRTNGYESYYLAFQYEFANRICYEISQTVIKDSAFIVMRYYGFDDKKKMTTGKQILESVKIN